MTRLPCLALGNTLTMTEGTKTNGNYTLTGETVASFM